MDHVTPRVRTGAGGMDVEGAVTGGDGTETRVRADLHSNSYSTDGDISPRLRRVQQFLGGS